MHSQSNAWSSPGSSTHSSVMISAAHNSSIASSLHTPQNNEGSILSGPGSPAVASSSAAGLGLGVLQPLQRQGSMSSRQLEPPRAPVRPVPSVILVPACDAPEIAMSMEGLLVD
jgi:hypothetical protein